MAINSGSFPEPLYDVFPNFSGEDVRVTFMSHLLKELDRKSIIAFKDNEIKRSQSLHPELKHAINHSRIAVVVFSPKYSSSSWCLEELVEIMKCHQESGQIIIPIFYGIVTSHVRMQTGEFGEAFSKTCRNKTEKEINIMRESLTWVANIHGYHFQGCDNEATLIETIANDILGKLNLSSLEEFKDLVGMEDHLAKMYNLLILESEQVKMVGIWGSSGIGKTTIAKVIFSHLSTFFQNKIFIDRAFVAKCKKNCHKADNEMKLQLQVSLLSKIWGKRDIKVEHIGVMGERLKHRRMLMVIDDVEDGVVVEALAGDTSWFGCGSRIIVITKNKQILRAHNINLIYEVGLPSDKLALEMLCQLVFEQKHPPDDYMELASQVVFCASNLPLLLNVFGLYLRGRDKEDWIDMLSKFSYPVRGMPPGNPVRLQMSESQSSTRLPENGPSLDDYSSQNVLPHVCKGNTSNGVNLGGYQTERSAVEMFSSRNWEHDVFPCFNGGKVRKIFLSHFLKELDRNLIVAFKDTEIERSSSLGPELLRAIESSRIALVVLSKSCASSTWFLDKLVRIMKCKEELGVVVIPIFYGLDTSCVRKQTGEFGKMFEKTCDNISEERKYAWRVALTHVANTLGYDSKSWDTDAKMIETIVADILRKLKETP